MNNKEILLRQYGTLLKLMGIKEDSGYSNINFYIKEILTSFMQIHKRVAIYCYGAHTQMLMADYVAELRDIVCIIDNGKKGDDTSFKIIKGSDIEKYNLDGIIVSSFRYKEEIKQSLKRNHSTLDVLDIYEELKKYNIFLEEEFYFEGPYQAYKRINALQAEMGKDSSLDTERLLLKEYVNIKDFRLAEHLAKEIYSASSNDTDRNIWHTVSDIYQNEINTIKHSKRGNTLLLCLDGMRREDFLTKLPKLYSFLEDKSQVFSNAYSYSTMTYESLVPVFSENTDQRSRYYLREEVDSSECRFIDKVIKEKRFTVVYGDGNHYIWDDAIKYSGRSQTVTEKIWDFALDIDGIDNGLFYLHELYESHYSFANPYTKDRIVSNGSAMLFDYLPQNNGHLRTNYKQQQEDALRYLDDTLSPFIEALPCDLVIFADHGNMVLKPGTELEDIRPLQLSAAEEWIQIPLVIKSKKSKACQDERLISLLELNNIMLAVLSGDEYRYEEKDYIKIGRSTIYNQQFKEIYRMLSAGYNGEAFEGFIFKNGYKLLVFDNGKKELYTTDDDSRVEDASLIETLYGRIKGEVTIL